MFKLCTIAFLAVIFSACENNADLVKNIGSKKLGVEEAEKIKVNYTVGGKIKTVLTAPLMLRVQDKESYIEFPKKLKAVFYNDEGVAESVLTAKYGKYKDYQSIVFLKDSVKVINFLKGDTLYTDELNWDRSLAGVEFYTDKPVKIRTKTQILNGIGMEASQDFKSYHITKFTGVISVPSSSFPE